MFAVNGILFNHESPVRGETFVTRKITRAAVRIAAGLQEKTYLGNLNARRDWGHAKDYVEGMYLMLQQKKPEDFVLATGETHSVREFCERAFTCAGIQLEWVGEGIDEKGINIETGDTIIEIDSRYFRPTEVDLLVGDPAKAHENLGWHPKYTFDELIEEMIIEDQKGINVPGKND